MACVIHTIKSCFQLIISRSVSRPHSHLRLRGVCPHERAEGEHASRRQASPAAAMRAQSPHGMAEHQRSGGGGGGRQRSCALRWVAQGKAEKQSNQHGVQRIPRRMCHPTLACHCQKLSLCHAPRRCSTPLSMLAMLQYPSLPNRTHCVRDAGGGLPAFLAPRISI